MFGCLSFVFSCVVGLLVVWGCVVFRVVVGLLVGVCCCVSQR